MMKRMIGRSNTHSNIKQLLDTSIENLKDNHGNKE